MTQEQFEVLVGLIEAIAETEARREAGTIPNFEGRVAAYKAAEEALVTDPR